MAGLFIGVSMYGYGAYYVAAPIILGSLVFGEIASHGSGFRAYRLTALDLGFGLTVIPIVYRVLMDDQFSKRFKEKQGRSTDDSVGARFHNIADNYSKYFSFDYLFRLGETGCLAATSCATRCAAPAN